MPPVLLSVLVVIVVVLSLRDEDGGGIHECCQICSYAFAYRSLSWISNRASGTSGGRAVTLCDADSGTVTLCDADSGTVKLGGRSFTLAGQ